VVWYFSFRLMWSVHVRLFPAHAGHLSDFWAAGVALKAFVSSFLLLIPLGGSSLVIGMILGNLLVWCIPPARPSFARDAGACPEIGFGPTMHSLLRWSWIPLVIGFGLSFIGACTLRSLR
jgi:hypothetical protein